MSLPQGSPPLEELLQRNKEASENHRPWPLISEMPVQPNTLIIACLDPRCNPDNFWGVKPGEALVVRNVGGRVADEVKTIWFMDTIMQGIKNLYIVHHTDCGASHATHEGITAWTKAHVPNVPDDEFKAADFGTFTDFEQSVRDDLRFLRESPLIRKEIGEVAKGFLYDIKTGVLSPVPA